MKLTIEIRDEKFHWEYEIGKERQVGDHPISSEGLQTFCAAMRMCSNAYINQHEEWFEKIKAKAFIERHYPELYKQLPKD